MYIFHREGGWYPMDLPNEEHVQAHAIANTGTLRVSDMQGKLLWTEESQRIEDATSSTQITHEERKGF